MSKEKASPSRLVEIIEKKLSDLLTQEGFEMLPPRSFQESNFYMTLNPQGYSDKGVPKLHISLRPKKDYAFYQWMPNPNTNLRVISRDSGMVIENKEEGKFLLEEVAGYAITGVEMIYRP